METKKKMGRPRLREETFRLPVYGSRADIDIARAVAVKWDCSIAEAYRRAMRQAAEREKV